MIDGNLLRVLIVDDDVDNCTNVQDILLDVGYPVEVAHDGPSALECARRTPFDMALIDYRMPGMDGATLFAELRKLRPEIVAIMITAYASEEGVARAQQLGTWRVLRKPVDMQQLLQLVREARGRS